MGGDSGTNRLYDFYHIECEEPEKGVTLIKKTCKRPDPGPFGAWIR